MILSFAQRGTYPVCAFNSSQKIKRLFIEAFRNSFPPQMVFINVIFVSKQLREGRMTHCFVINASICNISIFWYFSWSAIQPTNGISNSIINTFDVYYFWGKLFQKQPPPAYSIRAATQCILLKLFVICVHFNLLPPTTYL